MARSKQTVFRMPKKEDPGWKRFILLFFICFFDLVKLNILFLVTAIPVVTIPAAMTALSRGTLILISGEADYTATDYFSVFRSKFKQALPQGLLIMILSFTLGLSILMYRSFAETMGTPFILLAVAAGILLFALVRAALHIYRLIAVIDLPLRGLLTETKRLIAACFLRTFAASLIGCVLEAASFLLFPGSVIFIIFVGFSLVSFISSFLLYPAYVDYISSGTD